MSDTSYSSSSGFDPTIFIVIPVVFFVIVIGCICVRYYFNRTRRIRAALNDGSRVWMCNAATGNVVKIVGVVQPTNFPLIPSPIGGRPCAFYQVRVQEYRRNGRSHYWYNALTEEIGQDFFISDGTGMVRIPFCLPDLMAELSKGIHSRSGVFNNATPNCEALLNRHGQSSMGFIFNRTLRFAEGSLAPGDTVAVLARFERDPILPNVLVARPPPLEMREVSEHKIVLCDDPALYGGMPPLLVNQAGPAAPVAASQHQFYQPTPLPAQSSLGMKQPLLSVNSGEQTYDPSAPPPTYGAAIGEEYSTEGQPH